MDEEQKLVADYKKELEEAGIDLPESNDPPESESPDDKDETDSKDSDKSNSADKPEDKKRDSDESDKGDQEDPQKPLETQPKERKRSIYDDLKDKKHDLREEREAREKAERERDELRTRLNALSEADSPIEKKTASSDLLEYAIEKGADPELVQRIVDASSNAAKAQIDPETLKDLAELKAWKAENTQVIEKQLFAKEFAEAIPKLQSLFPNATSEEFDAMKERLDVLSHTREMHDKELDYVAFKHRDELSKLISPHKKGMETGKKNLKEDNTFVFDPNADLSTMSMSERTAWEKSYEQLSQSESKKLHSGKKILL